MLPVRRVAVCTFAALVVAPPAALGGDAPVKLADPPVKLRMSEYQIRLDRGHTFVRLPLFEVRNTGKVRHELVIVKTARTAKKLPVVERRGRPARLQGRAAARARRTTTASSSASCARVTTC